MTRRFADMVTAALLIMGLGYLVAISSRTLPGDDGGEGFLDASFAVPVLLVTVFRWAVLAIAGFGAAFVLLSVARASKGQRFQFRRLRVLLYWLIAFYLALQIRPPEKAEQGAGASRLPPLGSDSVADTAPVIQSEWVFGILVVAVAAALLVRFVFLKGGTAPEAVPAPPEDLPDAASLAFAQPLAPTSAADPTSRILNAYAGFEQDTRDAGVGRLVSETPRGHARRAGYELALNGEDVGVLEEQYESVRFGDREVASDDAERAETAWQRIKDRLGR